MSQKDWQKAMIYAEGAADDGLGLGIEPGGGDFRGNAALGRGRQGEEKPPRGTIPAAEPGLVLLLPPDGARRRGRRPHGEQGGNRLLGLSPARPGASGRVPHPRKEPQGGREIHGRGLPPLPPIYLRAAPGPAPGRAERRQGPRRNAQVAAGDQAQSQLAGHAAGIRRDHRADKNDGRRPGQGRKGRTGPGRGGPGLRGTRQKSRRPARTGTTTWR